MRDEHSDYIDVYKGALLDGEPHGEGQLTRYWIKESYKEGQNPSFHDWRAAEVYQGSFRNGKFHGFGQMRYGYTFEYGRGAS